ncbi:COG2426 family protein [Thermobrachium celere]|uniref:COG2426 family protein n=1 Tax=Thermobrachium celere TaxID=53422 RepID=UPI001945A997|nr:small multi-drug export protein [Thermobrachium celere]GFR35992.1 multidrug SMR transporter [Thermobrachium celere]
MKEILGFINKEFTVIFIACLPIIELRGAIPIGISLGLSPLHSMILSLIGSMIPVPFILFGVRPIFEYLRKTKLFKNIVHSITAKTINKSSHKIQKYGARGLVIFVAIPLPGTGVWSGSLVAALLDIRFKWAFPAILLGNLIAGVLIMGFSSGVVNLILS